MMIVPFGTDVKVTLIPKIGGDIVPKETIKHLKVCIVRGNSKKGFTPIYKVGDAGIEIEIQRHHIKYPGVYKIILDWRRPDAAYYDGYQDISNSCSFINFSTSCKVMSDNTADIEISPIYKGDKGDDAYKVWLRTHQGTFQDYEAWLQEPATDAVSLIEDKIETLDTAIHQEEQRELAEGVRLSSEQSRVEAEDLRDTAEALRDTAEASRVSAETLRTSSENQRTTKETARETAETDRVQSENERETAETTRISNENNRVTAEQARVDAEGLRVDAENLRVSSETLRLQSEEIRISAETERKANEVERLANEASRASDELIREANESSRKQDEATRKTNENEREIAETTRVSNENNRVTAEQERVQAESLRATAESSRELAESLRVEAELLRQSSTQEAISNAENATLNANTAAQNADDAREAIQSDLAFKANHGYGEGEEPKTLKEVEDNTSVKIENLVVNGNFVNGTTGWRFGTNITGTSVADSILSFTGGGGLGASINNWIRRRNETMYPEGHTLYNIVTARSLMGARFYVGIGDIYSTFNLTNQWGTYSYLASRFYSNAPTYGAYLGETVEMTNAMCFDLTGIFGEGNEPTKEEMDLLISTLGTDYFEGEITIPAQKVMQWQLALIRKNKNAIIALGGTII